MTRQALVFDASFNPDTENIPIVLRFTNTVTDETFTYEFEALGDPGIGGDFAASAILKTDPLSGKRGVDLNGVLLFFNRVLVGDGYERLQSLLDDKTISVDPDVMFKVFKALTEEYAGRPTVPSPSSSGGRRSNGATSTRGASSGVST